MSVVVDALNKAYTYPAKTETWYPRASGCGGCLRAMAHLAAGFPPRPDTPESERTFELGHQRGAELARRAKKIWPDAEMELEVSIPLPGTTYSMRGHLDLWIPSLRTIVDFKTAGGFKMGLLAQGKEGAGEDYEMQLQAYRHGIIMEAVNDPEPHNWRVFPADIRCVLVFESKDSDARNGVTAGQLIEVEVPHTEELESRFQIRLQAIADILKARDAGTLDPKSVPGMPNPSGHWRCRERDGRSLYCSVGRTAGECK